MTRSVNHRFPIFPRLTPSVVSFQDPLGTGFISSRTFTFSGLLGLETCLSALVTFFGYIERSAQRRFHMFRAWRLFGFLSRCDGLLLFKVRSKPVPYFLHLAPRLISSVLRSDKPCCIFFQRLATSLVAFPQGPLYSGSIFFALGPSFGSLSYRSCLHVFQRVSPPFLAGLLETGPVFSRATELFFIFPRQAPSLVFFAQDLNDCYKLQFFPRLAATACVPATSIAFMGLASIVIGHVCLTVCFGDGHQ